MTPIDIATCIAGRDNLLVEYHTTRFLDTLTEKCNLDGVNVFIVLREQLPVSPKLLEVIERTGFKTVTCPLDLEDNYREDTSVVCNWMVDNCGTSEWITITHFDVVFISDYFDWLRSVIPQVSMVGSHHDGVVSIRRRDYYKCGVGFSGVDYLRTFQNEDGYWKVVSENNPLSQRSGVKPCHVLDVGELLILRMETLRMKHVIHTRDSETTKETGKSQYFTHHRQGSGQGFKDVRSESDFVIQILTVNPTAQLMGSTMLPTIQTLGGDYTIHLAHEPGGTGTGWRIACMPNVTNFRTNSHQPNYLRSNEPSAVTCHVCKKTEAYREAKRRRGGGL